MGCDEVRAMAETGVGHQFCHRARHICKSNERPLHIGQPIKRPIKLTRTKTNLIGSLFGALSITRSDCNVLIFDGGI